MALSVFKTVTVLRWMLLQFRPDLFLVRRTTDGPLTRIDAADYVTQQSKTRNEREMPNQFPEKGDTISFYKNASEQTISLVRIQFANLLPKSLHLAKLLMYFQT